MQPRLFIDNRWNTGVKNRQATSNDEIADPSSSSSDDDDERNHNRREFSVNFPFNHIGDTGQFDYINATDKLELTIIPHQIIIVLLQGPSKTEFKLRLLDHNFDLIL